MALTDDHTPGGYPAAVALLKAVYDIVDRLKSWEEDRGIDGEALFQAMRQRLAEETAHASAPIVSGFRQRALSWWTRTPAAITRL